MIALGLGVHSLSIDECMRRYRTLCDTGFESKALTKSAWLGWLASWFVESIYKTEPFESALRTLFGRKRLFGHRGNSSRVAVTTTVDTKCRLLANYNWGDGKRYLDSNISTWAAYVTPQLSTLFYPLRIQLTLSFRLGRVVPLLLQCILSRRSTMVTCAEMAAC